MSVSALNSERWATAGASLRSRVPDWGADARLFPSREDRRRAREELKRRALKLWGRPGHKTQESIAQALGCSQAHVGVLLREAGVRVGRGCNLGAVLTRRQSGTRAGFAAENPAGVLAAARELSAMPGRVWGDLKRVALAHGVPHSSVHSKLRQMQRGAAG
jgi:transposase-like protein